MAVVRRTRNDRDTPREFLELVHTDLAAYGDHLIAVDQRMLHHVPPELARGTDDADPRPGRAIRFAAVLRCFRGLSANWNRCTPECLLCLHASTFPRKPSRYKQAIPANPPGANPVPTQRMLHWTRADTVARVRVRARRVGGQLSPNFNTVYWDIPTHRRLQLGRAAFRVGCVRGSARLAQAGGRRSSESD